LYIYDKWDWSITYPVIKISWAGNFQTLQNLESIAFDNLKENKERLGVEPINTKDVASYFSKLIRDSYKKYNQKVVILIDEYDKPILDVIEDKKQAKINREFIKGVYSIIKGNDEYIKFSFLTGVSKFSKASIFSGLNMLADISLAPEYGNICGYTQNDIQTTILPYLKDVDLKKLKIWYNGYNFLKDDVYNPFDILLFIANNYMYKNYWFETGTPTFLLKLIEKNNYFLPNISDLTVDSKILSTFDIENIDLEVILYQSGYLTIDKIIIDDILETIEYKLKIPNKEVQVSLNDFIVDYIFKQSINSKIIKRPLMISLMQANLEDLKSILTSLFASIPYNNYTNTSIQIYEGFYSTVIYVYLASLGIKIIGEDVTNKGRIDLSIFVQDNIYILEFKVDGKNGEALKQIKDRKYAQKYTFENKNIYLVGINFDSNEKNISEFEWEKVEI